jgi:hypothetical protein
MYFIEFEKYDLYANLPTSSMHKYEMLSFCINIY